MFKIQYQLIVCTLLPNQKKMFTSIYFEYDNFVEKYFTLQKKEVCTQLFDLEKCFKIDRGIHNGKTEIFSK